MKLTAEAVGLPGIEERSRRHDGYGTFCLAGGRRLGRPVTTPLTQTGPAAAATRNRTPITQENHPPMRPTHLAPAAALAAILLHGGTAGAQTPEYLAPLENGGVQVIGRTRNESCSVTTTFKSVDGRAHVVSVNQTPKWGPSTVTVPAGGQVTIVVNGDLVAPYTITVDGSVTIPRAVPRVTPGGVDCGTDPTTTVPPTSTTAPPELETVVIDDPLPPATVPPATTTAVVDPPTTTTPPAIELVHTTPTLPETGAARARATAHVGASLLVVGAGLAAWATRKAKK